MHHPHKKIHAHDLHYTVYLTIFYSCVVVFLLGMVITKALFGTGLDYFKNLAERNLSAAQTRAAAPSEHSGEPDIMIRSDSSGGGVMRRGGVSMPPVAPSGLTALAVSSSQINLSWTDNSSNEAGFSIEWATSLTGPWSQRAILSANTITYSDTGLIASTQYFYRVSATNTAGSSAYSNTASATTLPAASSPPTAPTSLTATAVSNLTINLAWQDNSNNETGFEISRASCAGCGDEIVIARTGANASSYSDTALNASTAYWYRVRAFNGEGNSAYTTFAGATTFSGGTGGHIWSLRIGGTTSAPKAMIMSLAADSRNSDVVVAGYFSGGASFGAGCPDLPADQYFSDNIFVAKYSSAGACRWAKQFGGIQTDRSEDIAVDRNGDVYVTGFFEGTIDFGGSALCGPYTSSGYRDIFIAKFSGLDGQCLWATRSGGSSYDYGTAIAVDGAGNILATGVFQNTATFGSTVLTSAGLSDIFLAKLSSEGQPLWPAKKLGGPGSDIPTDLAFDGNNNLVLTGYFTGTSNFGTNRSVFLTSADNAPDAFLAKFFPTSDVDWAIRFGGLSGDQAMSATVDGSNEIVVGGVFSNTMEPCPGVTLANQGGGADIFLVKFRSNGTCSWSKSFGSTWLETEAAYGVAVDGQNNVYLTGTLVFGANFGGGFLAGNTRDPYTAKFEGMFGAHQWSRRYRDSGSGGWGRAITTDRDGNVLAVGRFLLTLNLGGETLTSDGGYNGYLVKLEP